MAPRRPINTDYTKQVAEQGMAAVNARKTGALFDPTNYNAALSWLASTGYGPSTSRDAYNEWMQGRGFSPSNYAITVGRGNGKYGGFQTLGLLKDAVRGQSELMRSADRASADQLSSLAKQYLDQAEQMYNDKQARTNASIANINPAAYRAVGFSQAAKDATAPGYAAPHAFDEANKWLGETTDPYLSALELASQIRQTPLRNYATLAGANYGVDPNIIAGWFPEASTVTDFRQQRDLQALNNYGMTQSEYEQYLAGQLKDQAANDEALGQQQEQQYLDFIAQQTNGLDGKQIAAAVDMTVPQLTSLMTEDGFQEGYNRLLQAIDTPADTASMQAEVRNILDHYANDPALYGTLSYLFSQYTGA